jgi:hydroxyquinol 1,2-dioxygenase
MRLITEQNITSLARERWSTARSPRFAQILTALIEHLHAFARDVELTEEEWMAGIEWLTATGQISGEKRQEFILASDVLGLSMLVVQINHRFDSAATPATVLGPFFLHGSRPLPFGGDMSDGLPGEVLYITGQVNAVDGNPIAGAVMDVWQCDADGIYESQLEVDEQRLRAKFQTREDGRYCIKTIAPVGYPIPLDGPVGEIIRATEIVGMRPAHVHFLFDVPGYERLVTHLFRAGADYLDSDVVFGTKEALVVPFERREPGVTPAGDDNDAVYLVAEYDFVLQPKR